MIGRVAIVAVLALGCATAPSHHVRTINARRTPRDGTCDHPELFTDHGPAGEREAIAILTAECSDSHPEQCRSELQRAACEADADAVVDAVAHPIRGGSVRMVGTAVEWHRH